MSLTSTNLIQERIEEVALGEPTIHGQMAVFPILGEEEGTADYITLDEAISNGFARVTEIDKEGNVPELNFKNDCEKLPLSAKSKRDFSVLSIIFSAF